MTASAQSSTEKSSAIDPRQLRLRDEITKRFSGKVSLLPSHAWRAFGLTFGVPKEDVSEVFSALASESPFLMNMLIDVTAVDWMDRREPRFDVVYQFLSLTHGHRVCFKVQVSEEECSVPSVRSLWPTANFLEREVWDMYGISFVGHGDLRRILMYDEFVGHPLRKDYPILRKQPRIPLRVPELRNTSVDMQRAPLVALPTRRR